MRQLYIVNNNGEYSDHHISFVVADPEEWGDGIEELLLLRYQRYNSDATIDAIATQWRECVDCATVNVEEYLGPSEFVDMLYNGTDTSHVRRDHVERLLARWDRSSERNASSIAEVERRLNAGEWR